jgi:hypothetical protein
MSLTPPERETILTMNDEDVVAHIYSSQRPVITKLKKNPAATLLDEGRHDGSAWAEFEVPVELVRLPLSRKRKGKPMSEEHKALLAKSRQAA